MLAPWSKEETMSTYNTPREEIEARELMDKLAARGDIDALVAIVQDPVANKEALAKMAAHIQNLKEKTFGILNPRPLLSPENIAAAANNLPSAYRQAAANKLASKQDERSVEPLIVALSDQDRTVRKLVVYVLGAIGDRRAVNPIVTALRDADSDVRKSAVQSLGRFLDAAAIKPLVAVLGDEDGEVRSLAAAALSSLKDLPRIAELDSALKHGDLFVAAGGYRYFLRGLDPAGVAVLVKALGERGTDQIAGAFLASGNADLIAAALDWKHDHPRDRAMAM